jgi:hypothetical protein
MIPFVLKNRTKLPAEREPCAHHAFDRRLQIWVNTKSGLPVVVEMQQRASEFGETLITATAEGVDQSEGTNLDASQFGETTMTKAPGEGPDYSHVDGFSSSTFGESTKMTIRQEATGQEDLLSALASQFGETTITRVQREGVDQFEALSPVDNGDASKEAF